MVDYQTWFEVVHEEAVADFDQRGSLTRDLARYWNDHERDLRAMNKTQARKHAREILD